MHRQMGSGAGAAPTLPLLLPRSPNMLAHVATGFRWTSNDEPLSHWHNNQPTLGQPRQHPCGPPR